MERCVKGPALMSKALELLRLPGVKVEMSGDERCRELYDAFTRRHARWRFMQNKRWGAAMLRIPERFEEYFEDPKQAHLRRDFRRASRAGLTFVPLDPLARLDEILAINRSAEIRQGLPMHQDYLNEATLRQYHERSDAVFGVNDSDGLLRAYICIRACGEVACVERLLGHADSLRQGVMWVLATGTIRELTLRRQAEGRPTWFMYDMYFGAAPGLRQFKRWIGCEPYRVSWSWRDEP
jgi:hypothetical protein